MPDKTQPNATVKILKSMLISILNGLLTSRQKLSGHFCNFFLFFLFVTSETELFSDDMRRKKQDACLELRFTVSKTHTEKIRQSLLEPDELQGFSASCSFCLCVCVYKAV